MAFTQATIIHQFTNADGTAASGALNFALTKRMSQVGTTIVPAEITANLNGTGGLSVLLYSNLDAATVPQDAEWLMTMRILGASEEQFAITVPAGGGTVDLMSLLPQNTTGG